MAFVFKGFKANLFVKIVLKDQNLKECENKF